MTLAASANSVRYFTRPQATRVANTLDAQPELMIYCGYEYELATYVILNEVWAEPVNSKYYEIWIYGYDAYTGEEIYMPIDLSCIWLYNRFGNRMYSAAQYLRFRSTVATPNFYWTMPPYNPFIRHYHDPVFNHMYTYHYEIHRFGWRPPAPPQGGPAPYHPYYMRTPHTPAPVPPKPFTPGVDHPSGNGNYNNLGNTRGGTYRSTSFNSRGGVRTGEVRNNSGNPGVSSRTATNNTENGTRTNSTNRSNATSNDRGATNNERGTTANSRDNTISNDRGTTTNSRDNTTNNNRGTTNNSRGTTTNTSSTTNNRGTSSNSRVTDNSNNIRSNTGNTNTTTRTTNTTTNKSTNSREVSSSSRGTTQRSTTNETKQTNNNSRTGQNGVRSGSTTGRNTR